VRTLSRHFIARYLTLYATILCAAMLAIVAVELLLNFDQIADEHAGISAAASYLFLRLPSYYFRDLIPAASFAAALLCFGLAARAREITAVGAGGVSPLRMVVPILGVATVLALLTFVVEETLVLAAVRESDRRDPPGAEIALQQGSFWYLRGDTVFNVEAAEPDARMLRGVHVFETTAIGRLRRSLHADVARVEAPYGWRLIDATIQNFDPSDPHAAPDTERGDALVPIVATARDLALLESGARTLSLGELRESIRARAAAGHDDPASQEMLHARLTNPLSVVAFALVAMPLGLAVDRGRSLAAMALCGVATLGLFYTARAVTAILAASGVAAAVYGTWLLLGALAAAGVLRCVRIARC
jgi:lipopolysaccharide export system permease protein